MAAHGSYSSPIFLVSNPLSIQSFADIGMHLTHFLPPISFYTPWKQKTSGILMFSEVIKKGQWDEMG